MKPIGILTDSHSSISREVAEQLGIGVLAMPFSIDEKCYFEGETLTRENFFAQMKAGAHVATSQPAPADVMKFWDEALEAYEKVLYLPISSGLSGGYQTARMLSLDEPYENRVFVVDTGRVSTPLHRMILDALEMVEEGYSAEEIKDALEAARGDMVIYLGVETLEYLKKGGRITPTTAALGTLLNIKPVLKLDVGTLDAHKKCRGFGKAKQAMLEDMKQDLETVYKEAYEKGEVYLMAATSADEETTKAWVAEIEAYFPGMKVLCDYLPLAVCCHTGEGALGIGCSCRPKRPER